jgi:hypothetical protein
MVYCLEPQPHMAIFPSYHHPCLSSSMSIGWRKRHVLLNPPKILSCCFPRNIRYLQIPTCSREILRLYLLLVKIGLGLFGMPFIIIYPLFNGVTRNFCIKQFGIWVFNGPRLVRLFALHQLDGFKDSPHFCGLAALLPVQGSRKCRGLRTSGKMGGQT